MMDKIAVIQAVDWPPDIGEAELALAGFTPREIGEVLWHRQYMDKMLAIRGNVYAIQMAIGPIKIGFSRGHPKKRLNGMVTGSPWPLKLLGFAPGSQFDEWTLHRNLAPDRLNGEWFKPSEIVIDVVRRMVEPGFSFIEHGHEPLWAR